MAHGGGGRLMHQLIDRIFTKAFGAPPPEERHDSAVFKIGSSSSDRVAFTTDSFVVSPLFFPGGDIGSLAINGTVNDLSMSGAIPLYLSAGFIIEEGLPMESLWRIAVSMRDAADAAGVRIVTGDTTVVDRGKGDGVYINTAGVGLISHSLKIGAAHVRPGDAIILSNDIGRHGMAIMARRENLEFETTIVSDCAPLNKPVARLIDAGVKVHCLRDLTRGGLAASLVEIAEAAKARIRIQESAIPIRAEVAAACEILGLDPIYVANEGCFIAVVPRDEADKAIVVLRESPVSDGAVKIGEVEATDDPMVVMKSVIGSQRIVDLLSGEQLPRIC
jgi:hydrogenase expression/formation protein HypE